MSDRLIGLFVAAGLLALIVLVLAAVRWLMQRGM